MFAMTSVPCPACGPYFHVTVPIVRLLRISMLPPNFVSGINKCMYKYFDSSLYGIYFANQLHVGEIIEKVALCLVGTERWERVRAALLFSRKLLNAGVRRSRYAHDPEM